MIKNRTEKNFVIAKVRVEMNQKKVCQKPALIQSNATIALSNNYSYKIQ